MKIYVDIIFLINLIYDFLILSAVNVVLKRYIKVKKIFIASFVGSISAFSIFIPFLNNIYVTIILSVLMILIAFGYKDLIYIKNNILYFYMISVIFGGFLYLLNLKFNHQINLSNQYNYKVLINFSGIILLSPIIYIMYLSSYKNYGVNHANYYNLKFSLFDKYYCLNAFYDSGNLVKDPYKGRPIILVNRKVLDGDIKNKSPIYVPCNLLNSSTLIRCFKPNLIVINDKVIKNCLIGIWESNFYDGINALISGLIGDKIR